MKDLVYLIVFGACLAGTLVLLRVCASLMPPAGPGGKGGRAWP